MKTRVQTKCDDPEHHEWVSGEKGYIDGYVRGGDNRPYVIVIIGDRIIMCATHQLTVIID